MSFSFPFEWIITTARNEVITVLQSSGWQLRRNNIEIMLMTRKLRNYNLFYGVRIVLLPMISIRNKLINDWTFMSPPIPIAIAKPLANSLFCRTFNDGKCLNQLRGLFFLENPELCFLTMASGNFTRFNFCWNSQIAIHCIIRSEFPSEWRSTQLKNSPRKICLIELTFEFISNDFRAMFGLFRHFSFSLGDFRCRSLAVCW